MLERAHRACIDVDVGVELDHADLESARLQHSTQRSGRDTFTERGHHAPGDKNESRLMRRVGPGLGDRKSVGWGKSVSVRVDIVGRSTIKTKKHHNDKTSTNSN